LKALFLDVDGVLNSTRTFLAFGGYPSKLHHQGMFDQVAIALLRRLCESAGISIVWSSAWRQDHRWQDAAQAFGLPIIDATPQLGNRGLEIAHWLAQHPEAEQYAILDDAPEMLDGQLSRFIQVDPREGLTWAKFSDLCELFGESPYAGESRHPGWVSEKLAWER
jgi:hypothetical protein